MIRRSRWRRADGPPGQRSRLLDYVLTLVLFGLLTAVIVRLDAIETVARTGVPVIVDGDSLMLDGEKIRLKGIDAPELDQICGSPEVTYQCGREAKNHLRGLIGTSKVTCQGWQRDKYQRLLGICQAGPRELNRDMVLNGWAVAYGGYRAEEAKARQAKTGIWAGPFEKPQEWRHKKAGLTEEPHGIWRLLAGYTSAIFGL